MKTVTAAKRKPLVVKRVGFAGLKKDLASFEKKYGMSTPAFVKKVWGGELEESKDFIVWLALSEIHHDMRNGKK